MPSTTVESPFGSPGARLGGSLVDGLFMYCAMLGGAFLGGFLAALMADPAASRKVVENSTASGMLLGLMFWGCAGWFLNFGILQGMTGKTLGKSLFKIKVVNLDGSPIGVLKSLSRSSCYWISYIPFGVGFAALLWNKNSQCWHDAICGTVVIKKSATYPATASATPAPDTQHSHAQAA